MLKFICALIISILILIPCSIALNQSLTITEALSLQYGPNSITLHKNMPDTTCFHAIVSDYYEQEFCGTGWWNIFYGLNYTNLIVTIRNNCQTYLPLEYMSIRRIGPQNTDLESITLYSERNYVGKESIITGAAVPTIEFHSTSLFLTGRSNWTLFERANYEGFSVCLESIANEELVGEIDYDPWLISTIGSIVKGCEDVCTSWAKPMRVKANTTLETKLI